MLKKTLVFAEVRNSKLKSTVFEILTKLRELNSGDVSLTDVVIVGENSKEHAKNIMPYGAQRIYRVETPETNIYQGEPTLHALDALVKHNDYALVIAACSPTGRDFFPRLAVRNQGAIFTDVTNIFHTQGNLTFEVPIFLGKCYKNMMSNADKSFITFRPNIVEAKKMQDAPLSQIEVFDPKFDKKTLRAKIKSIRQEESDRPDLTEASSIIAGGRALGSRENFQILFDCAKVLNGSVAATRAAVDSGYADYDMQVGQTGKTVSPNLYIACGLSGSIQHLSGMQTAKCVFAINTDEDAPIFQKSDYGIVADLFEAVPKLKDELKALLEKD